MGKRKSRTSKLMARPKKKPKLDTDFTCPFCNFPGAVCCRIILLKPDADADADARRRFAVASCRVCKEAYATAAHALTEPVDVYTDWIDSCEEASNKGGGVVRRRRLVPWAKPGTTKEDDA